MCVYIYIYRERERYNFFEPLGGRRGEQPREDQEHGRAALASQGRLWLISFVCFIGCIHCCYFYGLCFLFVC